MEPKTLKSWVEAYGSAWMGRDPQAAADLFTEDGTYQVTPFVEPMRGRSAIFDYWVHVTETERNIQFEHEILAVTDQAGIARWLSYRWKINTVFAAGRFPFNRFTCQKNGIRALGV